MKHFYVSLTNGLQGLYVKFEAESEELVRIFLKANFGTIWGGIYTDAYFHEIIRRRYPKGSRVINNQSPIKLVDMRKDT